MSDIADLGLRIDSTPAVNAAAALDRFQNAALKAERANEQMAIKAASASLHSRDLMLATIAETQALLSSTRAKQQAQTALIELEQGTRRAAAAKGALVQLDTYATKLEGQLAQQMKALELAQDNAAASLAKYNEQRAITAELAGAMMHDRRAADIAAYGVEMDRLRARFNPLFAASKQYEVVLDDISAAERVGAITATEATAARERERIAFEESTSAGSALAKQATFTALQVRALASTGRALAVDLALGMPPTMMLMNTVTRLGYAFRDTENRAALLARIGTSPWTWAIAGAAVLAALVIAEEKYEASIGKLNLTLNLHAAQLRGTRDQYLALVGPIGDAGNVSLVTARNLLGVFSAANLPREAMVDLASAARVYAVSTGKDVVAANQDLADSLQRPIEFTEKLHSVYGLFNRSEMDLIRNMTAGGDVMGAQVIIAHRLNESWGGLNDGVTDLTSNWGRLVKAISDASDAAGDFISKNSWLFSLSGLIGTRGPASGSDPLRLGIVAGGHVAQGMPAHGGKETLYGDPGNVPLGGDIVPLDYAKGKAAIDALARSHANLRHVRDLDTASLVQSIGAYLSGDVPAIMQAEAHQKALNDAMNSGIDVRTRERDLLTHAIAEKVSASAQQFNASQLEAKAQADVNARIIAGTLSYDQMADAVQATARTLELDGLRATAVAAGNQQLVETIDRLKASYLSLDAQRQQSATTASALGGMHPYDADIAQLKVLNEQLREAIANGNALNEQRARAAIGHVGLTGDMNQAAGAMAAANPFGAGASLNLELQKRALRQQLDEQRETVRAAEQAGLVDAQQAADARVAIEEESTFKLAAIRSEFYAAQGRFMGELADDTMQFSDGLGAAFGKASGVYKAAFTVSKGFAIAQAAINLQIALSNAMALPFPLDLLEWGKVAAMGGAILSNIASISGAFSGQGHAMGIVGIPGAGSGTSDSIPARLSAGESVVTAAATRRNRGALMAMNNGAAFDGMWDRPSGGGVKVDMIQNPGVYVEYERVSDDHIILLASRVVDEKAGQAAARDLYKPNSQMSKAVSKTVRAPRIRP